MLERNASTKSGDGTIGEIVVFVLCVQVSNICKLADDRQMETKASTQS